MVVREKYEKDLSVVQQLLVDICELSIAAFDKSVDTFISKDIDEALMILDQDRFINRLEEHIQDEVILLIAKQQPVATDLRRLIMIISAASNMERVGDYAVNIAKETIRQGQNDLHYSVVKIKELRVLAIRMLRDMLKAFQEEDLHFAKEVSLRDDEIDKLYGETIVEIIESAKENGATIEQVTQLSFICKYIERAADHATNLAEALFFLMKGKHYELNH